MPFLSVLADVAITISPAATGLEGTASRASSTGNCTGFELDVRVVYITHQQALVFQVCADPSTDRIDQVLLFTVIQGWQSVKRERGI